MDTRQLSLISDAADASRSWRLDEHTRQVGRQGVAAAREALRSALARQHTTPDTATGPDIEPHAA